LVGAEGLCNLFLFHFIGDSGTEFA
jgi:hypothetical protein